MWKIPVAEGAGRCDGRRTAVGVKECDAGREQKLSKGQGKQSLEPHARSFAFILRARGSHWKDF